MFVVHSAQILDVRETFEKLSRPRLQDNLGPKRPSRGHACTERCIIHVTVGAAPQTGSGGVGTRANLTLIHTRSACQSPLLFLTLGWAPESVASATNVPLNMKLSLLQLCWGCMDLFMATKG